MIYWFKSGLSFKYFCRRSFVTWEILFSYEEDTVRRSTKNTLTKFYQLELNHLGIVRTKVKNFNVLIDLLSEVLVSYLISSTGNSAFLLCLWREEFAAVPDTLNQELMVVMEGRRQRRGRKDNRLARRSSKNQSPRLQQKRCSELVNRCENLLLTLPTKSREKQNDVVKRSLLTFPARSRQKQAKGGPQRPLLTHLHRNLWKKKRGRPRW